MPLGRNTLPWLQGKELKRLQRMLDFFLLNNQLRKATKDHPRAAQRTAASTGRAAALAAAVEQVFVSVGAVGRPEVRKNRDAAISGDRASAGARRCRAHVEMRANSDEHVSDGRHRVADVLLTHSYHLAVRPQASAEDGAISAAGHALCRGAVARARQSPSRCSTACCRSRKRVSRSAANAPPEDRGHL